MKKSLEPHDDDDFFYSQKAAGNYENLNLSISDHMSSLISVVLRVNNVSENYNNGTFRANLISALFFSHARFISNLIS
jgi:hypothetical protein